MPLITLVRLVSLTIKLKSCHTTLGGGGGFVTESCPTLATSWAVARQATLFTGFSRQGFWSGLPFPSPGDLPNPGIEPESPTFQAEALLSKPPGKSRRVPENIYFCFIDYAKAWTVGPQQTGKF